MYKSLSIDCIPTSQYPRDNNNSYLLNTVALSKPHSQPTYHSNERVHVSFRAKFSFCAHRCSMCALVPFSSFFFFFPFFQSGSASGLDLFPLHVGQETMGRRWLGASDKEMGSRWIMQRWKWALSPHSAISKSKENCGNPAREFISCQMIVKSKLELQVVGFFFPLHVF